MFDGALGIVVGAPGGADEIDDVELLGDPTSERTRMRMCVDQLGSYLGRGDFFLACSAFEKYHRVLSIQERSRGSTASSARVTYFDRFDLFFG